MTSTPRAAQKQYDKRERQARRGNGRRQKHNQRLACMTDQQRGKLSEQRLVAKHRKVSPLYLDALATMDAMMDEKSNIPDKGS